MRFWLGIIVASAIISACAAAGSDAPTIPTPPAAEVVGMSGSCQEPYFNGSNYWMLPKQEQIEGVRTKIAAYVEATRAFRACMNSALDNLRAVWRDSHRSPDPVVVQTVDLIADDALYRATFTVMQFDNFARLRNSRLQADDPNRVKELDLADIDLPAQPGAQGSVPALGRLTMPSHGISNTHACNQYYPPISAKNSEIGRLLISYDVTETGRVTNVHIVSPSGSPDLDAAGLSCAATQWRNTPAIVDGVPVPSSGRRAIIEFRLN